MTIIGITGGIGSGKSVVSRVLHALNTPTFDCDRIAKNSYTQSDAVRQLLEQTLGDDAYTNQQQTPNYAALGKQLFNNPSLLHQFESLIHPFVEEQLQHFIEQHKHHAQHIAVESAILMSSGLHRLCDLIIEVTAPETLRIERVQQRSGLTPQQISERIRMQAPEAQMLRQAQQPIITIINDGTTPIIPQLRQIIKP